MKQETWDELEKDIAKRLKLAEKGDDVMYINPFLAGILVTIGAELLIIVIAAFFLGGRKKK